MKNIIKKEIRRKEKVVCLVVALLFVIASTDTSVARGECDEKSVVGLYLSTEDVAEVTAFAGMEPVFDSYIDNKLKLPFEQETTNQLEDRIQSIEVQNSIKTTETIENQKVHAEESVTEENDSSKQNEKNKNKEKKKVKKKKAKKQKGFSEYEEEEYLLAQIIEVEVGGVGKKDKIYTGSVVINRARTNYKDFKAVNTIKEVLYQGYQTKLAQQYATTSIEKIENGVKPSKESIEVAQGLISGDIECLEEKVLYQMEYKMSWAKGSLDDANLPNAHEYYGIPKDFKS